MSEALSWITFIALCNVALYIIMMKWNMFEWLQGNVPQWVFPSRCEFCLFHRLAFIEVLIHEMAYGFGWSDIVDLITYPMAAAVLSLFFYRRA